MTSRTFHGSGRAGPPSVDGVGVLEGDEYVSADETLATLHGYETADALIGQSWTDLYTVEDDLAEPASCLQRARETGRWHGVVVAHHATGSNTPVSASLYSTVDGLVCTVRRHDTGKPPRMDGRLAATADRSATIITVLTSLVRSLVECQSRTAVELTLCNRLSAAEPYANACVYAPAIDAEGLRCRATPDDSAPAASERLAATAFETAELQRSRQDDHSSPAIAVPLCHDGVVYGVVVVERAEPTPVDDREEAVLATLGTVVGVVITALRRRDLLFADTVVDVTFSVEDPRSAPLTVTDALGCRLDLVGQIGLEDGWLVYFDVEGAPAADVAAALDSRLRNARVVSDQHQWNRVECVLADGSLVDTIVAAGASIRSARLDHGIGRVDIEAPIETDLRELVAQLRNDVARLDVQSVTEHERPPQQAQGPDGLLAGLTDCQRNAIRAAYRAGYYDWPRQSTAEEVADALEIAAPTLHAHLRKAESAILDELVDDRARPRK